MIRRGLGIVAVCLMVIRYCVLLLLFLISYSCFYLFLLFISTECEGVRVPVHVCTYICVLVCDCVHYFNLFYLTSSVSEQYGYC